MGVSLNRAELAATNLLNNLVKISLRFCLGKCMADLSKRFFQISVPKEQKDLFRLICFEDNLEGGEPHVFHFTRPPSFDPYVRFVPVREVRNDRGPLQYDHESGIDELIDTTSSLYALK